MVPTAMVCSSHFSTTLSLGDGPHWLKLNSDFGPFGSPDPGDGGGLDGPATAGRIGPGLVTTNVTARPVARARARAPLRCLDTRRAPPLIWTFASSAQSTRAMTPIAKATKASTPLQAAARDGCIGLCGQLDQDEWGDLLWFQQEPAEFCRFLALLPRSGAGWRTEYAVMTTMAAKQLRSTRVRCAFDDATLERHDPASPGHRWPVRQGRLRPVRGHRHCISQSVVAGGRAAEEHAVRWAQAPDGNPMLHGPGQARAGALRFALHGCQRDTWPRM